MKNVWISVHTEVQPRQIHFGGQIYSKSLNVNLLPFSPIVLMIPSASFSSLAMMKPLCPSNFTHSSLSLTPAPMNRWMAFDEDALQTSSVSPDSNKYIPSSA